MVETAVALAAGLLVGSFLNVCIHRMPRDESVVRPRSRCPHCRHRIGWYDNLPLASWLALGGRCRHCRGAIAVRYVMVELATAALVVWAVLRWGPTLEAGKFALFAAMQLALVFSDLETRILPDQFTIGGAVLGLATAAVVPMRGGLAELLPGATLTVFGSVMEAAIAAAVASGSLWLVGRLYQRFRRREGLGLGDVKMVAMIGAFLGLPEALLTLILGSVAGSVGGLIYIKLTRQDASTYELPFGSFLGVAALAVAFLGRG